MKRYGLEISGTKRAGCAGAVESAPRGVKGVRRGEVGLEESGATAGAHDRVRHVERVGAIEEAAYPVRAGGERSSAQERLAGGGRPARDRRPAAGDR